MLHPPIDRDTELAMLRRDARALAHKLQKLLKGGETILSMHGIDLLQSELVRLNDRIYELTHYESPD